MRNKEYYHGFIEPDKIIRLDSKNIKHPVRDISYTYLDKYNGSNIDPINKFGYCTHCGSHEVSLKKELNGERYNCYTCNNCGSNLGVVWN